MTRCDSAKTRQKAHRLLHAVLDIFAAPSRFAILSALIPSPFPAISSLLIHRIKEEVDHSYHGDRYNDNSPAYFCSAKIMEVLPLFMHAGGNVMDRMDEIVGGLNLYRYLLLKDRAQNKIGICSRAQIIAAKQQFLDPLKSATKNLLHQFESSRGNTDHYKEQSKLLGLPQLSLEEYQQASEMAITSILLLRDLIERIEEITESHANE